MALDRAGCAREALVELEAALRLDPRSAQANYMIGTLFERAGRDAEATARYAAAEHAPESVEAHLRLADAYSRAARVDEALPHYRRVLEAAPDTVAGRFGEAMALARLGRHREARDRLAAARERHPDQPVFAMALARLLAASPDAGVRTARVLRLRPIGLDETRLAADLRHRPGSGLPSAAVRLRPPSDHALHAHPARAVPARYPAPL